jgi:predicted transcriptional regulator
MKNDWESLPVERVMSSPVRTLTRDMSLDEAVKFLTREQITGAPVVNHHGEPVGVLSLFDVAIFVAGIERGLGKLGSSFYSSALRFEREGESPASIDRDQEFLLETRIDDVMTPDLFYVAPGTSLGDVVQEFTRKGVHRLLVVDAEKRIQGVVSPLDIMSAIAGA